MSAIRQVSMQQERKEPSCRLAARGGALELSFEADVVGPADYVVSRRVGGKRLAAHERRSLVGDVRETRRQFEVLDDVPVRIQIEVVIGSHPRCGGGGV